MQITHFYAWKTQNITHTHLLELTNKFSKVAGYKINIQTSVLCLHNDNKLSKKEMKKTILFIVVSKRMKYPGINLNKVLKGLYAENYKTLIKEIKET